MAQRGYKVRITRAEYYRLGGMANSSLFRKADSRGVWQYFRLVYWES